MLCLHAGQAQPVAANPRVRVGGQPVVTQPTSTRSPAARFPRPRGQRPVRDRQWITAATRVRAGGVPVLLQDSQAICAPTGTGLNVVVDADPGEGDLT